MKYISKIYTLALAAMVAFGFASCSSDDDYTPAAQVAGMDVYFPNAASVEKMDLSSAETSFTVPVNRVKDAEAANVAVNVEIPANSKIKCDNPSVAFAAGVKTGALSFSYNPDEMEYDVYDTIKVAIKDVENTSVYGVSEYTIVAGIPAPWVSIGKGKLVEDWYWGFEEEMDIYQNQVDLSLYRIENVFNPSGTNASPWLYFKVMKAGETLYDQTVPEDGLIRFYGDGPNDSFNTGVMNSTYGADISLVYPVFFKSFADDISTWYHNKVIGYKEDGTPGAVQLAPFYYMFGVGGWNAAEDDNAIVITFPGYVIADYSSQLDLVGRLIDAKGNGQVIVTDTLGADVASAKVAMAAGKDATAAYKLIQDGDESVKEITTHSELRFPYAEPGDYTVVSVTYDAEGNEQEATSLLVKIPADGSKETYSAIYKGTYTHCATSYNQDGSSMWTDYDPEEGILYVCDQDENKYMISPWVNLGYAENETEGQGLVFTMDEEGTITVDGCYTGVTDSKYGDILASDFVTSGVATNMPSYYSKGVFNFYLTWFVEAGNYGYTLDTFEITGAVESAAPRFGKLASASKAKKLATPRALPAKKTATFHNFKLQNNKKTGAKFVK